MPYKFNPFTGNLDIEGPIITGSGTVSAAADGTAQVPGINFASDLNTGIYRPGNDQLAISTGGNNRLFIASTGNVGIGTITPKSQLHVAAPSGTTPSIKISDANQTRGALILGDGLYDVKNVGVWRGNANSYAAGGNYLNLGGYSGIAFSSGAAELGSQSERMRITDIGRVGIGTSAPTDNLHVSSSGLNPRLKVESTGTSSYPGVRVANPAKTYDIQIDGANNGLRVYDSTAGAERMRVDSAGRLLVGTSSSPSGGDAAAENAKLVVSGRVGNNADSGRINLQRGSAAANSQQIGVINFTDGSNNAYARLEAVADGVTGTGDYPGRLVFSTTADGASSPSERVRITSAGNVGIGTSSPSAKVQVGSVVGSIFKIDQATANETKLLNDRKLTLGSGSGYGTNIAAYGSAGFGNITFETSANGEVARIDSAGRFGIGTTNPTERLQVTDGTNSNFYVAPGYNSGLGTLIGVGGGEYLSFATGGLANERMRITSAGNVGIGTSSVAAKLDVAESITAGTAISRSNSQINILSGTGAGTDYRSNLFFSPFNTSGNGSPAAISAIASGNTSSTLAFYTNPDNQYSGTPVERMRITSDGYVRLAGGGIQFNGDTAAANALDDYEEGTWTPVFIGTSTAGTPTYGTNGQAGKYTKVGNKVTAWAYIDVTALGGAAGNINITGLPFAISNIGFGVSGISVGHADGTLGNGVRAYHNTTFLELRNNNSVVTAATGQIYVSITYTT